MASKNKIFIEKKLIEEAINNTPTMGAAAKYLGIEWRTFKVIAEEYNLYKPIIQDSKFRKYELTDILAGKHPQYPTSKLSKRLVSEGYKEYKCEKCFINSWNGKHITLELNHIDGNNGNHSLENLQLLCPNCHSQTPTFKSKNVKLLNKRRKKGGTRPMVGNRP